MEPSNVLAEDLPKYQHMLEQLPLSDVLREIARVHKLSRPELAMLLGDLFGKKISTSEVQAVWHWDLASNGRGLSDAELNEKLAKLKG